MTRNCDWAALGAPDSSVTATGQVQRRLNAMRFAWEGLTDFVHKIRKLWYTDIVFPGFVEKAGEKTFICEFR
jgi:hypothetical protein